MSNLTDRALAYANEKDATRGGNAGEGTSLLRCLVLTIEEQDERIAALEREMEEAREALRPFAERGRAEFTTGDFRNPEPAPESQIFGSELFLTVGDLRRATLAHARLSPSPSELAGDEMEEKP